jgi:hypothetical protein
MNGFMRHVISYVNNTDGGSIYANGARTSAKLWCVVGRANLECMWAVVRRCE